MGIQATEVGFAQFHEDLGRTVEIACARAVIGPAHRIRKRVLDIEARQHLLHLKLRPRAMRDERLRPIFDRIPLFSPVMLCRTPDTHLLQPQRSQAKCLHVKPGPYTAKWDSPGNNVDAVRVGVPKPAALPATIYLHGMATRLATGRSSRRSSTTAPTITSVVPAYRAIPGSAAKEFRLDITLSGVPSGGAWPLERRPAH